MQTQTVIITLSNGKELVYAGDVQVTPEMQEEGIAITNIIFSQPFDWDEVVAKVIDREDGEE